MVVSWHSVFANRDYISITYLNYTTPDKTEILKFDYLTCD